MTNKNRDAEITFHPTGNKIAPLQKNCVISAVGSGSLHSEWMKGNPDFDLHLNIYDHSYPQFRKDTPFICQRKGYKLRLIYQYLEEHPEFLEHYDYFFLPDDDLQMDAENISCLFRLMEEYHLQIAQPALTGYSYYEHTARDKNCILRYTNFVEFMAPCFSREALKKVLFTFNENASGWGTEGHWPQLIGFTGKEIAVIDRVHMVHTRPNQSINPQNMSEMHAYLAKYNIVWETTETGYVPLAAEELERKYPNRWLTDYPLHKRLNKLVYKLAKKEINTVHASDTRWVGLQGLTGKLLFLAGYFRLTERQNYLDSAFSILELIYENLFKITKDASFHSGLAGLTWCVEYLSQQKFVENQTDAIIGEVCKAINEKVLNPTVPPTLEELNGWVRHYMARMKNPHFNPEKEINRQELKVLKEVISWMRNQIHTEGTDSADQTLQKCLPESLLLLLELQKDFVIEGAEETLGQFISFFNSTYPEDDPSLLDCYTRIQIAAYNSHTTEKQKALMQAMNYGERALCPKDLLLLRKLHAMSGEPIFKTLSIQRICRLLDNEQEDPWLLHAQSGNQDLPPWNSTVQLGLILLLILSDEDLKLEDCIL